MRILLVHRYFWPDTPPYAHILRDVAVSLEQAGHDVTVLTCQPSYNLGAVARAPAREVLGSGVTVRRFSVLPDRNYAALKVVNLVTFCVRVMLTGLRSGEYDVVMAASTPPIGVAKTASWLARLKGARFVYHKQDIYPEVVLAAGIMPAGPWASALRRFDSRTDRAAKRVVVLSDDMANTVSSRGVAPDRISVINNFDPWHVARERSGDAFHPAQPRVARSADAPLTVVFAGNLGRFQNLETVLGAAESLKNEGGIAFHFFGDGALREEMDERVSEGSLEHVHLHGHRPPERVAAFLRERADLGIVSLAPGVVAAAYPSKTMSYLRSGCAVLALVEEDSELVRTILGAGAGFHSNPTDGGELAETLRKLAERRADLTDAGIRAYELYEAKFAPERQLPLWLSLFEAVVQEQSG